MNPAYAIPAVAAVVLATVLIGGFGLRLSRTTSDFYVASRSVGPGLNAAAISGEYLSAASFLGVAGLLLVHGPDMLWYPVGYTAGYLVLLVFVAAPLRRSGAYTLPDFAESRLESRQVRLLVSMFVVGAGWLYLVPQLQGAGLTLSLLTGAPRWLGGAVVAAVVILAVAAGGMRSITFVQAFQYWLKLTALLVPAFFLLIVWHQDGGAAPSFPDIPAALLGGAGADQPLATSRADHPLYATYGLIVATVLGTMGLPHVVVRFYTSPHGRAARRTTLMVLTLVGFFYLLPPVYGWLGRLYAPALSQAHDADATVLLLPGLMVGGVGGDLLGALVAGGAFAAFLSTASGLTMAVAGVLSQDVLPSRGCAISGSPPSSPWRCRSAGPSWSAACPWPTPSAWPSPSPPPPSVPCSSSASGGGGSPRPAPSPGSCWAAAPRCSPWASPSPASCAPAGCTPCSPGPPSGRCPSASSPWSWSPSPPPAASRRTPAPP